MKNFQDLPPQERGLVIAKLYHNIWYDTSRFENIMELLSIWEEDPIREAKYLHEIHDSINENDLIK